VAKLVAGEDVEAVVTQQRGGARHRVEDLLDVGADELLGGSAPPAGRGRAGGLRCAHDVEQVGAVGLVELERARERAEHTVGYSACVTALRRV
jgi:hypothetical protein